MDHRLDDTIALLTRTPAALNALLRDLPESWTHRNEGEKTWSAYDIVGHLIHGEKTDWIPRARRILHAGESVPFDKFDREAQFRDSEGKTLPALLDEFARLRTENLALLRGMKLQPADLTHLHQLSRVMAHQYRDAIGPWPRYMGVLRCSGHSE